MVDDYTQRYDKNKPNKSHFVQRLKKPWKTSSPLAALDNVFAFGGGIKNGGLSKEALSLLDDIFRFDYMGSAEFEWGAVPSALKHIANNIEEYEAFSFELALADVAQDWRDKNTSVPEGTAKIYMLCNKNDSSIFMQRVMKWALERYNKELKESTQLASTLRPFNEWDGEVVGWLELNNGFIFFTDREMWEKTCDLFGVKH